MANWMVPGKMVKGMGGTMDLAAGVTRVVVIMEHVTKSGEPRVRRECTLPLTGAKVVNRLITDPAVFDFDPDGPDGPTLVELQPGVTVTDVELATEASFTGNAIGARSVAAQLHIRKSEAPLDRDLLP